MLDLNNLTLGYNRHPIVHHLSISIANGDSVAIVGPNGGGKSTLLKSIMSIITPLEGHINCQLNKKQIAYLPQGVDINKNFPISTKELIAMGLWKKKGWFKNYSIADEHAILHALDAVGLKGLANTTLNALSGGQIQRALFARLILQDASLILLDEPFNAVDIKTTNDLIKIVKHWQNEHRTIIAVLHNYEQVKTLFKKTLILACEPIAFGNTEDVLTEQNLRQAFNIPLFQTNEISKNKICQR